MTQPEIRCGGPGFDCAYCIKSSQRRAFCNRCSFMWDGLCTDTRYNLLAAINRYNSKCGDPVYERRRLQRFIDRLMLVDKINRLESDTSRDQVEELIRVTLQWEKCYKSLTNDYASLAKYVDTQKTILLVCALIFFPSHVIFWGWKGAIVWGLLTASVLISD
jgi:hypothetical protein